MWIKQLVKQVLTYLTGESCLLCKREGASLCAKCLANLPRNCEPLPSHVYAHFSYKQNNLRKLILNGKYYHKQMLFTIMTEELATKLPKDIRDTLLLCDAIVPIPSHKKRIKSRGQDHTQTIAKTLSHFTTIKHLDLLARAVFTKQQVATTSRKQRLNNPAGSFALSKNLNVSQLRVCLVDDVITTGATTSEAKRVLESSGHSVDLIIALAH